MLVTRYAPAYFWNRFFFSAKKTPLVTVVPEDAVNSRRVKRRLSALSFALLLAVRRRLFSSEALKPFSLVCEAQPGPEAGAVPCGATPLPSRVRPHGPRGQRVSSSPAENGAAVTADQRFLGGALSDSVTPRVWYRARARKSHSGRCCGRGAPSRSSCPRPLGAPSSASPQAASSWPFHLLPRP